MKTSRTHGFSIVEVLVIIAIVVIIASLGYVFFTRNNQSASDESAQQDTAQEATPEEVTTVESSSDIDKATEEIDQLNFDDTSDDETLNSSMSEL